MKLTKHHGLGNDFLITWADEVPDGAAALAVALCDRHTGVGADGLVFGVGAHPVEFVLFNADGSRPEVSGNGLRCFGQALAMRDGLAELNVTVATLAGPRQINIVPGSDSSGRASVLDVEVDMGSAIDGPSLDGRDPARHVAAVQSLTVDMGNPHVVIEVADPMSFDMAHVGPLIEADFLPTGINVHLVAKSPDGVVMNIWERGAGVTQACGSGACAVATAAHQWGWSTDDEVSILMPGGEATVTVGDTIRLRGPAAFVGHVEINPVQLIASASKTTEGTGATHG